MPSWVISTWKHYLNEIFIKGWKKTSFRNFKYLPRTQTISFPFAERVTCALDKISEGLCFHQWLTFEIKQIRCLLEAVVYTTEQPIYIKSLQTEPALFKPQDPSRPRVTYLADPIFVTSQFIGKAKETCELDKITICPHWKPHYLNHLNLAGQSTRRICCRKQTYTNEAGKKWPNGKSPFCSHFHGSVLRKAVLPQHCESFASTRGHFLFKNKNKQKNPNSS